jgi:hypothetical protein
VHRHNSVRRQDAVHFPQHAQRVGQVFQYIASCDAAKNLSGIGKRKALG